MLTTRGGVRVIADLTQMGYDTTWTVMGAAEIGAPHQRDRMWIVSKRRDVLSYPQHNGIGWWEQQQESPKETHGVLANPSSFGGKAGSSDSQGWQERNTTVPDHSGDDMANPTHKGDVWREWELGFAQQEHHSGGSPIDGSGEWWSVEPAVGRVAHGVACRVDRLKAIGNGQVPACAAAAWRLLTSL